MAARAQWRSRLGFILAASGSAVGLGNIWKFPYITGENGGGAFVLVYLTCIVCVGFPVLVAEILVGRAAQKSPVGAYRSLASAKSPWQLIGWMGVLSSFVILSYYGVVAGWSIYYTGAACVGLASQSPSEVEMTFKALYASTALNILLHVLFVLMTVLIVGLGVRTGIEKAAKVLMPALLAILFSLFLYSTTTPGFSQAVEFVFAPRFDELTAAGVLEALGHAFFTLSVGMCAMLTYGSYMNKESDLVSSAVFIAMIDTAVALLACLVLFPITFSHNMQPDAGPGLVFIKMPIALSEVPGGTVVCFAFFVLLFFAALTSAVSVLEVATSYFIDQFQWSRWKAALVPGITVAIIGIPAALSGGTHLFGEGFAGVVGKNFFDSFDYLASNWLLPLGGFGTALFVGWRMDAELRRTEFQRGSALGWCYQIWLLLLKYFVPIAMLAIFLHAVGVF